MTQANKPTLVIAESTMKRLTAMANKAAENASRSLQKLSDNMVSVVISEIKIQKVRRIAPDIGAETLVAGVYLRFSGDISGATLLVFPEKIAYLMCDLLLKRQVGTTHRLTELDKSALKEVGNILCGSFLTVLSNMLGIKIIEHLPDLSFDMFGAVVDGIVAEIAQGMEEELVVKVTFSFAHSVVNGYVVLIFGLDEINAIAKAIENARAE